MFSLKLDCVSLVCGAMLLFCGGVALMYCSHYFGGLGSCKGLFYTIVVFICVMLVLVFRSNLLLTLVMWEYLGLVRFILILYYSKMGSLRSSVITLVSSRLGDVALFIIFGLVERLGGVSSLGLRGLLLRFVVLTKSACYPLVSWLVEAMRAHTPVSSLVHSSTLVAAGV